MFFCIGPFIYVDLAKHAMPSWAAISARNDDDFDDEPSEYDSLAKAIAKQTHKPKLAKLSLPQWVAAFETYAIAADTTGHCSYSLLKTHMCTCLRVMEQEKFRNSTSIGIEYDKLVRQNWARKAELNVPDFEMRKEAGVIQVEILAKATQTNNDKPDLFCTYCQRPGHDTSHCFNRLKGKGKGKKGKGKGKDKGKNEAESDGKVQRRPMKYWGGRSIEKPTRY